MAGEGRTPQACERETHHVGPVSLMYWAVDSDLLDKVNFPRRVMPKLQERPPDRLTDEEVDQVGHTPGALSPSSYVAGLCQCLAVADPQVHDRPRNLGSST